nr:hypothetical protein GCM10020063_001500 [Dactylosporangium thailandense]
MRAIAHHQGRHIALPLGGIGTGSFAIGADGGLRQWQLTTIGNHLGTLPNSFFALRVARTEPPVDVLRVLQAPPPPVPGPVTPLVNDDVIPSWQRELPDGVTATTFRGCYPFAQIDYHDPALPVTVSLEAFTPLVPLDLDASGLPAAMFTFTITNPSPLAVHGWLGAALQNAVGSDGTIPPDGCSAPGYGGNVNRLRRTAGWTQLVLDNPSATGPGAGQMVLACDSADAPAALQWTHPDQFLAFLRGRHPATDRHHRAAPCPPSPAGTTWAAGLAAGFALAPGATAAVRVVVAWHFPHAYADFQQFGPPRPERQDRFVLGTRYSTRFADAIDVAEHLAERWGPLRQASRTWTDTLLNSSLPTEVAERLAAQPVALRTPTTLWAANGKFFGFEGVLGASTRMWAGDIGGSCAMNCTHVWNYAQAPAQLFPAIERDMRETEFDVMQAPDGHLPHRVIVPTYLPQLWDGMVGAPGHPAVDGMLGAVLKTYREVRSGAGLDWLDRYWPRVLRLLEYIRATWDPDATGILTGRQPSTHDIDLHGANPFIGTLWLAALRAAEEMAYLMADSAAAEQFHSLFDSGATGYDELLWNGEYYEQALAGDTTFQWGGGCLSDQLIGQWWAHQLDLGYILPAEHVRTALRSIVRHNLRKGFRDFAHGFRVFADADDTGLLLCTWPRGGRPNVPTRYADEVWSGVEYQVAAHCIREGLTDEGMSILRGTWARHDGSRRNPYNEIECGDHYVRAMAGWTVLDALTGRQFDAVTRTLTVEPSTALAPERDGTACFPFIVDTAWGAIRYAHGSLTVECRYGDLKVDRLRLPGLDWTTATALVDERVQTVGVTAEQTGCTVTFASTVCVPAGATLRLTGDGSSPARSSTPQRAAQRSDRPSSS